MNILYIKQHLLGRPFRCGGGGDDSGGATDSSLSEANWDSMNDASTAALAEAIGASMASSGTAENSLAESAQQAANAGFNGSLEGMTASPSAPADVADSRQDAAAAGFFGGYEPHAPAATDVSASVGGWANWADVPEDRTPTPDTAYEDTARGAKEAAERIADEAKQQDMVDFAISLLGFAIGGPFGKAVTAFGPSLVAGEKPGGRSVGSFLGGMVPGGGAVTSQIGGMIGHYVDTGRAPGWSDWGGLATSAAGWGAFPGRAIGEYMDTGKTPSAAAVSSYAASKVAAEFGISPSLAANVVGAVIGGLEGRGYSSPEAATADLFGGGGGWDDSRPNAGAGRGTRGGRTSDGAAGGMTGGTSGGATTGSGDGGSWDSLIGGSTGGNQIQVAPYAPSNGSSYRIGGFGLSEGGQGMGLIQPDFIALRDTGASPVVGKPGVRMIAREGKTDTSGQEKPGEAPFNVVLARTIGGRRKGF